MSCPVSTEYGVFCRISGRRIPVDGSHFDGAEYERQKQEGREIREISLAELRVDD